MTISAFKISKGPSARIATNVTPFDDGRAYLTPDDGGFYIDSEDGGVQRRIRINPPAGGTAVDATLLASGWSSERQALDVAGVTDASNGYMGLAQDITDEQWENASAAKLRLCGQADGSVTVEARGVTPSCDIPVTIVLMG